MQGSDWGPHINWLEPPEEREHAQHFSTQLHMLRMYVIAFSRAVHLIDHCENLLKSLPSIPDRQKVFDWTAIAARDAAMTIYHFRSTLYSVQNFKHCPTLQ